MNQISVIIPSKNADNLIPCVYNVRKHEATVNIIVIDDGLDDTCLTHTWKFLNDPVAFIEGIKPFIYARACNQGIMAQPDHDIVLLNDDALLETPGGFTAMQQQHYEHPEYGIIGSSIDMCGTPNQHRHTPDRLRLERVMLVFACVFIPRSTIQKIGLLDERFCVGTDGIGPRGYGLEDDDYSWRCRQAGMKLGVYDGCFVNHTSLKSTFRGDPAAAGDVKIHEEVFRKKWGIHPRRPIEW